MKTMSEVAIDQRQSPPLAETPDIYGAYPRLSDDQIATLEAAAPGAPSTPAKRWSAR